jgi:hypothetical protein
MSQTVYNWYEIFNTDEFDADGLISQEYEINLVGIGLRSVLVTKGFSYSIVFENRLLTLNMADENPFEFEGYAIYQDEDNNVWLGAPSS